MRRFPWLAAMAVCVIALTAVLAPVLLLASPVRIDIAHRLGGASAAHPLGRDELGRDELSRLIWGARSSLTVAFGASLLAGVIGIGFGVLGGFFRGVVELLTVRTMDIVLCFPPLLLALLVVTVLGPGIGTLIPVLALLFLPGFTRVAYAGVLATRALDYVEAVRVLGVHPTRIMLRTILPNIGGPLFVQFSLAVAAGVILESGLSFLGLGVVPPTPSWGLMIGAARATMTQDPALLLWPCLALSGTVLSINALCDGLGERADPHGVVRWRRSGLLGALLPGLAPPAGAVLALADLTVAIETPSGTIHPVREVSLSVGAGETLALVGESGSGKTLTGLALLGVLPDAARVTTGAAWLEGREILRLDPAARRTLTGSRLAMIFQDPTSSLNPLHRVGAQIVEAIRAHQRIGRRAACIRALSLLRKVGIADPEQRLDAFPHELSGGMRQRVMIAIAIANEPRLIVADEPTTALDVTIQAQILDLLATLQRTSGLAMIFITHSLPVVAEIAERVAVMYAGEIVEEGAVAEVFAEPRHPYTSALLASAPDEGGSPPRPIPGTIPQPHALPKGCAFTPRCPRVLAACEATHPPLLAIAAGHRSRCIRATEA
ncbi:MAG: dipeptide/oligopeptide/nickel ABC transporter permease/ATP-binding protein [Rhodospirillales bacterium]|nr:dipeptide/oligopeptide/nickel ABC transporter permease/ATP-binding protein [Rhodospirillales bacterium]